jgi:site-specific recombinase XerD
LNGVDLKSLSVVMGHTTSRTCENYIHLAEKHSHLEEAMLKVNARPPSKPRAAAVRRGA